MHELDRERQPRRSIGGGPSGGGIYATGTCHARATSRSPRTPSSAAGGGLYQRARRRRPTTRRSTQHDRRRATRRRCGGTAATIAAVPRATTTSIDDGTCGFTATGNLPTRTRCSARSRTTAGRRTRTRSLAGSPAIDTGAGLPARPTSAASRGPRGRCDIGAFESSVPAGRPARRRRRATTCRRRWPGKTVNALPKSGTVKVKLPGTQPVRRARRRASRSRSGRSSTRCKGRVTLSRGGRRAASRPTSTTASSSSARARAPSRSRR